MAHVDDADAAQLHIIADDLRGRADQNVLTDQLDLYRVVRHQAVAALDELKGGFAFSDAAVARQQHALAVDLHQHAVGCQPRREIIVQQEDDPCLKLRSVGLNVEHVPVVFLRHLKALGKGLALVADDKTGNVIGHESVKGFQPRFVAERLQIGRLDPADNLNAFRIEVIVEAGQLHGGPVDVRHRQQGSVVILRKVQGLQLHLFHDGFQRDRIVALHHRRPPEVYFR